MGEVLLVYDTHTDRTVAMKLLKPSLAHLEERVLRFLDEAKCQAGLQHPGIISVYDIGRADDGRLFFTMRAVQGLDFSTLIKEVHEACAEQGLWGVSERGWSFRRLVQALKQCADAIAFAHEQEIVHRDIKPQNLIVGPHGEPLVLDWGIAKVLRVERDLEAQLLPFGALAQAQADHRDVHELETQCAALEALPPPTSRCSEEGSEEGSELETIDAPLAPPPHRRAEVLPLPHPSQGSASSLSSSLLESYDTPFHTPQTLPPLEREEREELKGRLPAWLSSDEPPTEQATNSASLLERAWSASLYRASSVDTLEGTITGTPAYMSPEQAAGRSKEINATTDVYALGCVLYHVLTGRPPYTGKSALEMLGDIKAGRFPRLRYSHTAPYPPSTVPTKQDAEVMTSAPEALIKVCERAMRHAQQDRYPTAQAFAQDLGAWLEGQQQRQEALELIEQIPTLKQKQRELMERAQALALEAKRSLEPIPQWASEAQKAPSWALEDESLRLLEEVERLDFEVELTLQGARSLAGGLPELHQEAAAHYLDSYLRLSTSQRTQEASRALAYLRDHSLALYEDHPKRALYLRYLSGEGSFKLSLPSTLQLALSAERLEARRLRPSTPELIEGSPQGAERLFERSLKAGSYVALISEGPLTGAQLDQPSLQARLDPTLRYPVLIEPVKVWESAPPEGARAPQWALAARLQTAQERFVPAGWCWVGDREAPRAIPPTRLWIDDVIIQTTPVTHRDYLRFLNSLLERGERERALEHVPQELASSAHAESQRLYQEGAEGFCLPSEPTALAWTLDMPVTMVNWWNACAYAAWYAQETGKPWRLPSEWEWEKAARGVDARAYPWGSAAIDPSWACHRLSHQGSPKAAEVHHFDVDSSPYGVRGMAGNTADWCLTPHLDEPPVRSGERAPAPHVSEALSCDEPARVAKGGAWDDGPSFCHLAVRHRGLAHYRRSALSFRLAYSLSELSDLSGLSDPHTQGEG